MPSQHTLGAVIVHLAAAMAIKRFIIPVVLAKNTSSQDEWCSDLSVICQHDYDLCRYLYFYLMFVCCNFVHLLEIKTRHIHSCS